MKTIKIQIKSWVGKLIFEYECENNTIKETLRNAVLSGADLRNAVLRNADLRSAVLSDADLRSAVLSGADLSGADLSGAVLSGADLSGADLSGADLSDAVLPIYSKWNVSIQEDKIKIGCKVKSIEEWDLWFCSNLEYSTKRNSGDFKRIQANYLAVKAYYEFLNKQ
jgi:hypothetical protein